MAEALFDFAVEAIVDLLKEAKLPHSVSEQVERFLLGLDRMQSLLRDADARQHDEEIIKKCISEATDLAYKAAYLIEIYALKVASRRRKGIRSILRRCVCILNEFYDTLKIGTAIQTLKDKIPDPTERFREFRIRKMMEREGGSSSSVQKLRRTYSHDFDDHFVGLHGDVELLVNRLVMDNEIYHPRVVSICGMGGSGKSTVARKVYHHPSVKRYFDGFVWICISQRWRKEDILRQILTRLIPEKIEEILKWTDEKLVRELFQMQQRKKYLLVLDDIWSVDAWECIRQAFPVRKDGTKILLTTRNRHVAEQIDPNGFHHQLRLLSEDESWVLFQMKASCRGGAFEMLGKEMVKPCGGHPLAVVVIGGILATKRSLNEWKNVYNSIKAHLQEQGNVQKILALSYNDLPHWLKPCFLYLGRFDEDTDIDVESLYQLWIAEGLISTKDQIGEESMMCVAERYLAELVQRRMVQAEALEMPSILKSFTSCRLHDLMRDLSLCKAEEENFLLSKTYGCGVDDEIANNSSLTRLQLYRLVIRLSGKMVPKYIPLEKRITRHLRSLALIIEDEYEGRMSHGMKSQFNQFKMLRVLIIEGLGSVAPDTCKEAIPKLVNHWKLPKAIGKLIHLRYFSLRGQFIRLPSSIGHLHHLETLDLRDVDVLRIPNVLWKLKQLRHLYLPRHYDIPNLGHLRLDGSYKLEILENFCIPLCHIIDISNLKNLLALSATIDEELGDTSNEKLSTAIGQCFFCCSLQRLVIDGPIGNLPKYEARFSPSLIKLSLRRTLLTEDPMKILEMLPNLRSLFLSWDSFMGKEMRCTGLGFRQLRNLSLDWLSNLEKWWVDDGAMPNLSCLTIDHCQKLEMIPDELRSITTLQELTIKNMPREFTKRIQVVDGRERTGFHRVAHIPSIIIK